MQQKGIDNDSIACCCNAKHNLIGLSSLAEFASKTKGNLHPTELMSAQHLSMIASHLLCHALHPHAALETVGS